MALFPAVMSGFRTITTTAVSTVTTTALSTVTATITATAEQTAASVNDTSSESSQSPEEDLVNLPIQSILPNFADLEQYMLIFFSPFVIFILIRLVVGRELDAYLERRKYQKLDQEEAEKKLKVEEQWIAESEEKDAEFLEALYGETENFEEYHEEDCEVIWWDTDYFNMPMQAMTFIVGSALMQPHLGRVKVSEGLMEVGRKEAIEWKKEHGWEYEQVPEEEDSDVEDLDASG